MKSSQILLVFFGIVFGFSVAFLGKFGDGGSGHSPALRVPASSTNSENILEVDQKIKSMKSVQDVKDVIAFTQKLSSENPDDKALKIYSGLLKAFKWTESSVYKYNSDSKNLSSSGIWGTAILRKIHSNGYRAGSHLGPVFDYILGKSGEKKKKWKHFSEFQNYYLNTSKAQVDDAIKTIEEAIADYQSDENLNKTVFTFDIALVVGDEKAQNLLNAQNRYLAVTVEHVRWLLADLYRYQGNMVYLSSYDFDGLSQISSKFKKKYGVRAVVDKIFKTHYSEVPYNRDFYKEIHKSKYKNLFTLRNVKIDGKDPLVVSKEYFQKSVDYRIVAIKGLEVQKEFSAENKYIISPNLMLKGAFTSKGSLEKRRRILSSNKSELYNDPIFSQAFEVNMAEVFNSHNPAIRDLKKLMPKYESFQRNVGKKGDWPKYFHGDAPSSLPDLTLGGVIPAAKSMGDIRKALEILSHDSALPMLSFWLDLFI